MYYAQVERCPNCTYDLCAHPAPNRCPECGFTYDAHTEVWKPKVHVLASGLVVMLAAFLFGVPMLFAVAERSVLAVGLFACGVAFVVYVLLMQIVGARRRKFVAVNSDSVCYCTGVQLKVVPWDAVRDVTSGDGVLVLLRTASGSVDLGPLLRDSLELARFTDAVRMRRAEFAAKQLAIARWEALSRGEELPAPSENA